MTDTDDSPAPSMADRHQEMTPDQILEQMRTTGENPMPVTALQIETSSICNFRCASCVLAMGHYDRPEKYMKPDEFRRILDAFPTVRKIELQGIGEVFLNRDVFAHIAEATSRGIDVHTFTNTSRISPEIAEGIVASGLQLIHLSMDAADDETFRALRKGGNLERFRTCATNLVEARTAAGSETPRIDIMSVLSKRNVDQVQDIIALAEELGVESLTFTKLNMGPKEDQRPYLLDEADRERLRALPPYEGPLELHWAFDPWNLEERRSCYWPRSMAYVTVDGYVTPCCNYYDHRELYLGHVDEKSGDEIWNDKPYREFRKRLLGGDLPMYCGIC